MDGWKCWFYGMNLMILHFAKLSQGEKVTFMERNPQQQKTQSGASCFYGGKES